MAWNKTWPFRVMVEWVEDGKLHTADCCEWSDSKANAKYAAEKRFKRQGRTRVKAVGCWGGV